MANKATKRKQSAAKRTSAKPQPSKVAATKTVEVADTVSVTGTPKSTGERETRNVVEANTAQGFQETPESQNKSNQAQTETETSDSTGSECQDKRRNGMTCLDEMGDAKANPQKYSATQQQVIADGKNLCPFCLEQE